ncbi:MAG: hypothetical protein BroJett024_37820 [Alphaproteobacteria bacterium]|nr:MAG: hypothetical protein BroJett024_37820 [Alphaproteobacteria bacterium]
MLKRIGTAYDFLLRAIVVTLMLCLASVGVLQVFFRYVVESSLFWTEELGRYLLIWLVMIAAAVEVERGTHIAVRTLVDLLPNVTQRWLENVNLVLVTIFSVILTVYGFQLAMNTMGQLATTLPVSIGQLYLALPVGGALITVNALRVLWKANGPSRPPVGDSI